MSKKAKFSSILAVVMVCLLALPACQPTSTSGHKSIVVTYSIMGSIVKDLIGDAADVTVSVPNGLDPHDWEPSAKDIEAVNKADLIVENGLGLEGGMLKTLDAARQNGVKFFTAADHIEIHYVGAGEGIPSGDPDQVIGAPDPHLWMDPLTMKSIVAALVPVAPGRTRPQCLRAGRQPGEPPRRSERPGGEYSLGGSARRPQTGYRPRIYGLFRAALSASSWSVLSCPACPARRKSPPQTWRPSSRKSTKTGQSHLRRTRHVAGRGEDHRRRDRGESRRADHPRPPRRWVIFHLHEGRRRHHRRRVEIGGVLNENFSSPLAGED